MSFGIWQKVVDNHKDIKTRLEEIARLCGAQGGNRMFLTALSLGLSEAEFMVKTNRFGAEPLPDDLYQGLFKDQLLTAYRCAAAARGKTLNPALDKSPLPAALAKAFWFKNTVGAPILRVVNNCLPLGGDAKKAASGGVEFFAPSDGKIFTVRPGNPAASPGVPLTAPDQVYDLLLANATVTAYLNVHRLGSPAAGEPPAFADCFEEVTATLLKLGITGDAVAGASRQKDNFLIVGSERRSRKVGKVTISDTKGGEYYVDFVGDDDDPQEKVSALIWELGEAILSLMKRTTA